MTGINNLTRSMLILISEREILVGTPKSEFWNMIKETLFSFHNFQFDLSLRGQNYVFLKHRSNNTSSKNDSILKIENDLNASI